ncbi:MAG: L,D-transpeptidase [Verrucomicrobiota bacterium]
MIQLLPKTVAPLSLFLGLVVASPATLSAGPFKFLKRDRKPKPIPFAPEPPKTDTPAITQVQIYLDSQLLGPGKIDGGLGEFTRKAVTLYNVQRNITPPKDNWGPVLAHAAEAVPQPFAPYVIKSHNFDFIDPALPVDYPSQAKREYLPYRRLSELLSERFHTDEKFIQKLNPNTTFYKLKPGDVVTVPNVATPFLIENVPKHERYEEDPLLSSRQVIVDTNTRIVTIVDPTHGNIVAAFPITPGKDEFIHRGNWTLKNMVTTPEFRYDKSMLDQGVRSDDFLQIPPGPNSPVGIIWCGTSKSGIGIHGTASPHTIGRSTSAGCIRLANWDAIRLPSLMRPGASITIR